MAKFTVIKYIDYGSYYLEVMSSCFLVIQALLDSILSPEVLMALQQ